MAGLLGRPRKTRAFVSSTFRDLKFERRFVMQKLEANGFEVVSMEVDCKKEFDWRRWSINQAGQCDLFIFLFADRIGTPGQEILDVFVDISELEIRQARASALTLLEYQLKRPFCDQGKLFLPSERDEYLETLTVQTDSRYFIERLIRRTFREGRGSLIDTVSELERRLEVDTRVSWVSRFLHKMRFFYRGYFDQNYCAWRRAFEDERYVDSTHRLGFSWRLGKMFLVAPLTFAVLFYALPVMTALFWSVLLLIFAGLIILAYRPSFVWVGTKTVVARGAFGRLVQHSIKEPFHLKPHWAILNQWTEVGALSVEFADGTRLFVPFVNDPYAFVRDLPGKLEKKRS